MSDPVSSFVHDHRDLNRLVIAVASALARVARGESGYALERDEVVDALSAVRDQLFCHFALEEEGLFPSLRAICPDAAAGLAELEAEHGALCSAADQALAAAQPETASVPALVRAFEEFQALYAAHAAKEAAVLEGASARLSEGDRAAIARAVADL